jgi:MerR family copper efflux transcriptional regulator
LLVPAARTAAGYRVFQPDSVRRMQLIRAGLSIGFSVSELAEILRERNSGGAPCRRVRKLAAEKLVLLEDRLRELQSWRRELRSTISEWDRTLAKTPRGEQARLLEQLATHPKAHARFVGRGIQKRREP